MEFQSKPTKIRDFQKELCYYYYFNPETGEETESFDHATLIKILSEFDCRLKKLEENV
jgi:hypothetical protein